MGLSDGRKSFRIGLAVLIQYRSVTDTHPASQPARHVAVAITLYAKASSVKIPQIWGFTLKSDWAIGKKSTNSSDWLECKPPQHATLGWFWRSLRSDQVPQKPLSDNLRGYWSRIIYGSEAIPVAQPKASKHISCTNSSSVTHRPKCTTSTLLVGPNASAMLSRSMQSTTAGPRS